MITSSIKFSPNHLFFEPIKNYVSSWGQKSEIDQNKIDLLVNSIELGLGLIIKKNLGATEPVVVEFTESPNMFRVNFINRGVPISSSEHNKELAEFLGLSSEFSKIGIQNKGYDGQTLSVEINLQEPKTLMSQISDPFSLKNTDENKIDFDIRLLKKGEEHILSELFYHVYGYNYINEFVYYPEQIERQINDGSLISFVAVDPEGRFAGHVGLVRQNQRPIVYEPCLGAVSPRYKSQGVFKQVFQATMEHVKKLEMSYCILDCVTNHDLSQRLVHRYGAMDMALFIGCQSKDKQARLEKLGIGKDSEEMDRFSLLYSILPKDQRPFGAEVMVHDSFAESFGFLLDDLKINIIPTPRFNPLPADGRFEIRAQPSQKSVVFDLYEPGKAAVRSIIYEWNKLLKNGYQYAAVDFPLDMPGSNVTNDLLGEFAFFTSGFIPYQNSNRLGMRLQSIGHTKVAWEDIKVYSPSAKKLLQLIHLDYERKKIL